MPCACVNTRVLIPHSVAVRVSTPAIATVYATTPATAAVSHFIPDLAVECLAAADVSCMSIINGHLCVKTV